MTPARHNLTGTIERLLLKAWRVRVALGIWLGGLISQPVLAQTCTGLSNELAISQSFGTSNQPPSLSGQTTYRFVSAVCPENGEYAVSETIDGTCFNAAWHTVTEDHTPNDVRGNMLIVNASTETGAFYQQPLTSLCGGTPYEFSVWGLNLLRPGICSDPMLPNLTIRIETEGGRILQTINFGQIQLTQTPTWRRFATTFTAPNVGEPVVVRLINNQEAGGCGNDLALDDIQLKQCEVCPPAPVYVPDAFTPNRDGINDELTVALRQPVSYNLKVYNRWGSLLFTSDALDQKWDGTVAGSPCAAGEYTWMVTYELTDPSNTTRRYVQTGHVLLLR